jgi:hypothetical protein
VNFGLFSITTAVAGVALLAIGLWILQRLRVQHREIEVLSTLFWKSAIEETRARVFVRRFRHWWAWCLLVAIASILWALLGQPQTASFDKAQHVILIDWSVDDQQVRGRDLDVALQLAAELPEGRREIIAVGMHLETLLHQQEPLELAKLRSVPKPVPAPLGMDWAIESISTRAGTKTPITIHIVGDAPVDKWRLSALQSKFDNSQSPVLKIFRVERATSQPPVALATFGVSDAASGDWNRVDIWFAFADPEQVLADTVGVVLDNRPLHHPLVARDHGILEIQGVAANGGLLEIVHNDLPVGALTLPDRKLIRVHIDDDVPETLRQLIQLDTACKLVTNANNAEVVIGSTPDSNFRLTSEDQPAFHIQTENENAEDALADLVDELALRQIDATGLATDSGRVVDVQVASGETRSLALWGNLFTSSFDFVESRACPIVVGRAVRWLANRPPLVEWVELGRKLPVASPEFQRVADQLATTNDGRQLRTTRLSAPVGQTATLADSTENLSFSGFNLFTLLGFFVAFLLIGEWMLFQKGHMP